jgi:protocatechuate 3,4-dioxygenase beta subunit
MNPSPACSELVRVRSLLACELSASELTFAEDHLSHCQHCREKLEQAIGDQNWWQEARESLGGHPENKKTATDEEPAAERYADAFGLLGPTDDPRMLGRVGTYEIVGILGRGGMGVVFKGFDGALNRYVAIKMLAPHLSGSGAARRRFEREAQAAAAVVHDHVVAIHSVAEWLGVPYFVMPYVRGITLQKRLEDQGSLELREILRIGMQTAGGLAAAHAQGLVHRDVKPSNILVTDGVERIALMDFGLARAADDTSLTRTGVLAGTPQYMSPEQARGIPIDFRSDLFSLGSVLYSLCTGRPPFRAETSYGVLRLITDEDPTPIRELNADIPDWLCWIIGKLMAKQPEVRFASAKEVSELLETCLAHVQQPTTVPLPAALMARHRKPKWTRLQGVLVMATTCLLCLFGFFGWQITNPPQIAGQWTGDKWGIVTLEKVDDANYTGTYTDTYDNAAGEIQLKWSRAERRFKGKWSQGQARYGMLYVRLHKGEITGDYTTDPDSEISPGAPALAEVLWKPVLEQGLAAQKKQENIEHSTGVPVLDDIPLVDRLFKKEPDHSRNDRPGQPPLEPTSRKGLGKWRPQLSHSKWTGKQGELQIELQFSDDATATCSINAGEQEPIQETVKCTTVPGTERIALSTCNKQGSDTIGFVETRSPNHLVLTIHESKVAKYPVVDRFLLSPVAEPKTPAADVYGNSRKLAAMQNWSIAWDAQRPIRNGDHSRVAGLRVFADGRVAALQQMRDPLVEIRIPKEDVTQLIDWLIDDLRAIERPPQPLTPLSKTPSGEIQDGDGDPLPLSLWDQDGSRITVQRNGKTYDLLSIEPRFPERNQPESHSRFDVARQRLNRLIHLTILGGADAQNQAIEFANSELHKRYPVTPIQLGAENIHVVKHDDKSVPMVSFSFSARDTKYSFPAGEITLKVPRNGKIYVEHASYWTSKLEGQRWGREIDQAATECVIQGVLLDDVTGKPIANATIACGAIHNETGGGGANALTNAAGEYRLTGVSPGIYTVWLKSFDADLHATAIADEGLVAEAGKTVVSNLRLKMGRQITGKLFDEKGAAVAGMTIGCYSTARPISGSTVQSANTEQDGSFEFYLPPGRAYLYVMSRRLEGMQTSDNKLITVPEVGHVSPLTMVLRPVEAHFGSADWLERSTPGTQIVGRQGDMAVIGTVVDPSGKPIANARVFKTDGPVTRTDVGGQFRVGIEKGTQFVMYAQADGYRVWFGSPTSGDILKIVMEPKPGTPQPAVIENRNFNDKIGTKR